MLYNVLLVSALQQSKSAICLHISLLFWIFFPFRSVQSIEKSSLCHTVCSYWLFYFIHSINSVCVYIYIYIYMYIVNLSLPIHITPSIPPWYLYISFLCLCLYYCLANQIIYTIFLSGVIYPLISSSISGTY